MSTDKLRSELARSGSFHRTVRLVSPHVAGLRLSHPDRVLFSGAGVTKLELARYYEKVAPRILPQVIGRPLTLVRCPKGEAHGCFYMKHSGVWAPAALRRVDIEERTKVGEYLVIEDVAGLVALAQMDVLEIHTWNSDVHDLERPNRIVIDLDPGPAVAWSAVVEGVRAVRALFGTVGLESFLKTTGGKGLHVVVPVRPDVGWAESLAFSRVIAESLERQFPSLYTTAMPKAGRQSKILLDVLRNNRANTSVAAYSTRARPDAPLSMPVAWDELGPRLRPDAFKLRDVDVVLGRSDPWERYGEVGARQSLRDVLARSGQGARRDVERKAQNTRVRRGVDGEHVDPAARPRKSRR